MLTSSYWRTSQPTLSTLILMLFSVIHFLNSAETASTELPLLFAGKKPDASSFANIGTQDYSRRPQAVVLGGAFTNSMVDALRKDCAGAVNAPWMTAGMTEQQLEELAKSPPDPATYGPSVAKLIKGAMVRVQEEGKWNVDGVYSYR